MRQLPRLPRIAILIIGLIAVLLWIVFDDVLWPDLGHVSSNKLGAPALQTSTVSGTPVPEAVMPQIPARSPFGAIVADPFSPRPGLPAAEGTPIKTSHPAHPAPPPPPLPFRYAGQLHQGADIRIFLARDDDVFPVNVGDTLDGGYRVESIGESSVTLMYLPAHVRQVVEFVLPISENQAVTPTTPAGQPALVPGKTR